VEIKKKSIRALLDQKDIEKLQNKNKALEAEMDQLKVKLNP
jgi:cell division septum initiation protein DivIVA